MRATRGYGILEGYLSRKRAEIANSLISEKFSGGKILDIGCGTYPYFLTRNFMEMKFGIDKTIKCDIEGINFKSVDIEKAIHIPFKDNFFDVITLLAVIEHLNIEKVTTILEDCRRLLKKNGIIIITTPTPLGNFLLKFMSRFKIVSSEEIGEHKTAYRTKDVISSLIGVGFKETGIKYGHVQFLLNSWILAQK